MKTMTRLDSCVSAIIDIYLPIMAKLNYIKMSKDECKTHEGDDYVIDSLMMMALCCMIWPVHL